MKNLLASGCRLRAGQGRLDRESRSGRHPPPPCRTDPSGSWEDERGQTRYSIEFVVTGFGDVEILARGKPKADAQSEPVIVGEEAPKPKRKRAA
jgi:hypothetical protein